MGEGRNFKAHLEDRPSYIRKEEAGIEQRNSEAITKHEMYSSKR